MVGMSASKEKSTKLTYHQWKVRIEIEIKIQEHAALFSKSIFCQKYLSTIPPFAADVS